jgi:NhaP-type Na+/H+ or K+/H+ antiporter
LEIHYLQVLNQDETPLLYSLVFGEGVVNDATSVVLFNAIENLDIGHFDALVLLNFIGKFLYLFFTSTILGVAAGLLSAYIIKKLCFARSVESSLVLLGSLLHFTLHYKITRWYSA